MAAALWERRNLQDKNCRAKPYRVPNASPDSVFNYFVLPDSTLQEVRDVKNILTPETYWLIKIQLL